MDDVIPSIIYGFMWISVGIAIIVNSRRPPAKVRNLSGWKKAAGKITYKGLIQELDEEGDTIYIPLVRYEFCVGEQNYSIEKTTFSPDSARDDSSRDQYWNQQKAEKAIASYKEESPIILYYNTSNAQEAILDLRPMSALWNINAILFMLYGVYILFSCLFRDSCKDIVTIIGD
jgi:hypothetical protein